MRACSSTCCSGRHYTRLALVCSRLQNCGGVPRHERHDRRIAVLQCISASTDTTALAKLSAQNPSNGTDAAPALSLAIQRRSFLALATITISSIAQLHHDAALAEEAAAGEASGASGAGEAAATAAISSPAVALTEYANARQGYRLDVPAAWDVKGKAGADVLFEDPTRRSTSVGITVSPVKVASIQQFGGLQEVGAKLLEAERRKESTLDVALLTSSTRQGASGATLYEYEYELDSTRGRKRILNTVTIFNSRLYILNAAFKCEKEGCGEGSEEGVRLLRRLAASFDVVSG